MVGKYNRNMLISDNLLGQSENPVGMLNLHC